MNETISVIEHNLSEKRATVRKLLNEQDKLVAALSEIHRQRVGLSQSIELQEIELKQLYELNHKTATDKSNLKKCSEAAVQTLISEVNKACSSHSFSPSY